MTLAPAQIELISAALGLFFTVSILSYLIGDNILYRLALHIFIGVSVGYVGLVVIYQVLIPRLITPLLSTDPSVKILSGIPLILLLFLALKLSPRTAPFGNIGVAFLLGVGTAVAVGGTLTGTLVPQIQTTWASLIPSDGRNVWDVVNAIIIVVATITTLLYFQFWLRGQTAAGTAGRTPVMRVLARIGQGFVMITLGVVYGGMILSGIAVLSERVGTVVGWVSQLIAAVQ